MKLKTLLLFELLWMLVPVGLLLGIMFTSSAVPAAENYGLAAHTAALGSWVLVFPLTSVCACIVARRLVVGGFTTQRLVHRMGLRRVGLHVLPIALSATLVICIVVFAYSHRQGVSGWLEPALLASTLLAALAYASVGFALGTYLNLLAGAPLALLIPYLLIAFPPAMTPLWLRHMFYVENSCCNVSQSLSGRAVTACLLM